MYLSALKTIFFHESKQYEPKGAVWVHIICNIAFTLAIKLQIGLYLCLYLSICFHCSTCIDLYLNNLVIV